MSIRNISAKDYYNYYKSVNKEMLTVFTKKKLPNIKYNHVKAVIDLMISQLEDDLFLDKKIIISNFMEISLSRMPPKRGKNYYTGETIQTKGFNRMKFALNRKLNRFLMKHIDAEAYKLMPEIVTVIVKEVRS